MKIQIHERGNDFPQDGDILLDHDEEKAYRVLPDADPGDGHIEIGANPGDPNICVLNVEEEDYEEFADDKDAWVL